MAESRAAFVYRLYDAAGGLLYVGLTGSAARIDEHVGGKSWGPTVASVTMARFATRALAAQAERDAINAENPRHNIRRAPPKVVKAPRVMKPAKAIQPRAPKVKEPRMPPARVVPLTPFVAALIDRQKTLGMTDGQFAALLGVSRQLWQFTRTGRHGAQLSVLRGGYRKFPELEPIVIRAMETMAAERLPSRD